MSVDSMPSSWDILRVLQCDRGGCACHRGVQRDSGRRGMTHCPGHNDRTPSLSVRTERGKLLVYCHAGCDQERVIDALRDRKLFVGHGATAVSAL